MKTFIKDERARAVVPPWFIRTSRHGPWGVPANSCAVTGAPVADYVSPARLRGHVRRSFRTPSQLPGLSAAYLPRTLLFNAFGDIPLSSSEEDAFIIVPALRLCQSSFYRISPQCAGFFSFKFYNSGRFIRILYVSQDGGGAAEAAPPECFWGDRIRDPRTPWKRRTAPRPPGPEPWRPGTRPPRRSGRRPRRG